jgi:hypothetical protein
VRVRRGDVVWKEKSLISIAFVLVAFRDQIKESSGVADESSLYARSRIVRRAVRSSEMGEYSLDEVGVRRIYLATDTNQRKVSDDPLVIADGEERFWAWHTFTGWTLTFLCNP